MLGATLLAAVMNSVARHVMETVEPVQLVFFRNLFAFFFIIPMLWRVGLGPLKTERFGMHLGRAGLNVVNMMVWFTAISLAPLAEVTALGFSAPIFATILSVVFFSGSRRPTAVECDHRRLYRHHGYIAAGLRYGDRRTWAYPDGCRDVGRRFVDHKIAEPHRVQHYDRCLYVDPDDSDVANPGTFCLGVADMDGACLARLDRRLRRGRTVSVSAGVSRG